MVTEFLKSLVIPRKIKKYRYMSVLIAIAIFVISFYLLIIPFRVTINSKKDLYIEKNVLYVQGINQLESDDQETFQALKQGNYRIEDGTLLSSINDEKYQYYFFSYQNEDEKKIEVHFVFDKNNYRIEQIKEIREQYIEKYDNENRANNIAYLTFIEEQKNSELDREEYFSELHALSDEALNERAENTTLFDLFNIETSSEYDSYLIIFNEKSFDYQVPLYTSEGEKIEPRHTFGNFSYLENFSLDVRTMNSVNDLGKKMAFNLIDYQILRDKQQYTFNAIVYILLFPLVIIFILWLFLKRDGVLKRFKEYYNIAAITSVIPTLVTFLIAWFFPEAISLYGMLLSIYYVFILFRVNSIPDDI